MLGWLRRLLYRDGVDAAWKPTGIKPMARTWDVSRDHDDPRARRQLMAEVRARRTLATRAETESPSAKVVLMARGRRPA